MDKFDIAVKAMQGLLANPGGPIQHNGMTGWGFTNCTEDDVAALAFVMAEAMLKQVNMLKQVKK